MHAPQNPTSPSPDDELGSLLRHRLHQLADHAPSTVRSIDEVAIVVPDAAPPGRRRDPRRTIGIGASIAALVGAAGFTTFALGSGSDTGGAATPAEAVSVFVLAVQDQDVLSALDVVDPAEVGALRAALDDIESEAKRLDVIDAGFSYQGVQGLDIGIDGLQLSTNELTPDVAVVTATAGRLTTSLDAGAFPLGGAAREAADGVDGVPDAVRTSTADLATIDPSAMVATVQRGGRWYVSVSFTIAEYARQAAGRELPEAGSVVPVGFDSPEAATLALYQRLLAGDIEGAVATAAPGEGDALAFYAPLWLPDAQAAVDGEVADGLALEVSGLATASTGPDDRRQVSPTAYVVSGTLPADWAPQVEVSGPTMNPEWPTVVAANDDSGIAVFQPGEPLPTTLDGLELTSWEFGPTGDYNFTWEDQNGQVIPLAMPEVDVAPSAPFAVRIERSGDCTTFDAGASAWLGFSATDTTSPILGGGIEALADGSVRSCGDGGLGALSLLSLGGGSLLELPSVATVEVDGKWYVSPLGTAVGSIADTLRGIDGPAALFDSSLGSLIYGTDRSLLESILTQVAPADLPESCRAIAVIDGDRVTGVVESPSPLATRACQQDAWNVSYTIPDDVVTASDSGTVSEATEAAVPASTMPAMPTTVVEEPTESTVPFTGAPGSDGSLPEG